MEQGISKKIFRMNALIFYDEIIDDVVILSLFLKCEECSSKNILNENSMTWNVEIIQYMDMPLKNHYLFL